MYGEKLGFEGDSELLKAVKLLEDNGYYVTNANTEAFWNADKSERRGYTGYFTIRAIRKKTVPEKGIL
jgi:hypothetical protein